jgi:hypothetical protein
MKRLMSVVAVAALGVVLGGCGVPSLNALATPETTVADDGLVGTWAPVKEGNDTSGERYVISPGDASDKTYTVTIIPEDKDEKPMDVEVQIVKLGEHHFLDMRMPKAKRSELEQYGTLVAPLHNFYKVKREGDTLTVWGIDHQWLEKSLKDGTVKLAYAEHGKDKDPVLTASTEDLQAFFTKNASRAELFEDPGVLKRQPAAGRPGH